MPHVFEYSVCAWEDCLFCCFGVSSFPVQWHFCLRYLVPQIFIEFTSKCLGFVFPVSPRLERMNHPFRRRYAAAAAASLQLCPTLCDPIDGSPPGSPSLGFSRQEHWSGLPFPSPVHESGSEATQSCPTLRDPMDCSLPGSSVRGVFQARVLEWGAIAFSK